MEPTIVPSNGTHAETHATPVDRAQARYDQDYDARAKANLADPERRIKVAGAQGRADADTAFKRAVRETLIRRV